MERHVELEEPTITDQIQALQDAVERAEHAEAELARLRGASQNGAGTHTKTGAGPNGDPAGGHPKGSSQPATDLNKVVETGSLNRGADAAEKTPPTPTPAGHAAGEPQATGTDALREDAMMAHLLDSLEAGQDIGHYGRLVFAMVARHFLSDDDVIAELTKDRDFSEEQARQMLMQVEGRDYSPPRRARIMQWQAEQTFPIIPNADDPDAGNVYKTLRFPKELYDHIGHYQEEKAESHG